jgi:integrase
LHQRKEEIVRTKSDEKARREITDFLARSAKTRPGQSRLNIKDSVVQGFTLRVTAKGAKTFAMMMRDSTGRNRTYTIGAYPELTVKEARSRAERIRHGVRYHGVVNAQPNGEEAKSDLTLRGLLDEVEPILAVTKKGWRPRGAEASKSNMRATIECVFDPILDRPVELLTEHDLAECARDYKPRRPIKGKKTANGQVSRALAYLSTVLDWVAHRGKFTKIGAGRKHRLTAPVVRMVHDPSTDDPTITGKRERVLSVLELIAILPLLTFPAHPTLRRRNIILAKDYGPIAVKFLFLTLARREEVSTACWKDFDFINGVWHKPDTKTSDGQIIRGQALPLSKAALDLIRSLPAYGKADPATFVFPNRDGGAQDNWQRVTNQIQNVSVTSDWTRHDIRRTGSTLLKELGVPIETIDAILNHTNPLANANVSGSAGHYLIATRILTEVEDPKAAALNKLAEAYAVILAQVGTQVTASWTDGRSP